METVQTAQDWEASSPRTADAFDPTAGSGGELQPVRPAGLPQNVVFSRGAATRVDLTSDAGQVTEAFHQARNKGVVGGINALLKLRFETWLEERMKDPVLRKLEVRKDVAHAQKQAEDAQNALAGTLHDRSRSGQLQQIELNQLNRQRLMSDLAQYSLPGNTDGAMVAASPVTATHISKEQIETLALRAAMRLGQEQGNEAEVWAEYRMELYAKLPHNIAEEVERRIHELRSLLK